MSRFRGVGLGCVLACLTSAAHAVEAPDFGFDLGTYAGYDTNPLLVAGEGPSGGFLLVEFDADVDQVLNRRVRWFLDAGGSERFHESALDRGDGKEYRTSAGLEFLPVRSQAHRVALAVGARYRIDRQPFLFRGTGELYEVDALDGGRIAIPERYDTDIAGAFLDLYANMGRRTRLFLLTGVDRVDFVEDYREETSLEPLDHREVRVEPGVRWRPGERLELRGSLRLRQLDYDEHPARDASGDLVPGSERQYRYADLRLSVRLEPAPHWLLDLGARGGRRDDTYAGYYDYDSLSSYARVDYMPTKALDLRLVGSIYDRSYTNLSVPLETEEQPRSDRTHRLLGRLEWAMIELLELVGEVGIERTTSVDPLYEYDRDWVLAGVRFSKR